MNAASYEKPHDVCDFTIVAEAADRYLRSSY
jgi:hypothetical protein